MGGPWWDDQNPIRYARQFKTPMLLTVGEKDFRVPMNNTLENGSVLQRMKVPGKLAVFENAKRLDLERRRQPLLLRAGPRVVEAVALVRRFIRQLFQK